MTGTRNRLQSVARFFAGASSRRAAFALFDQAIVGGTNFVTLAMVGRSCGTEELGVFALALSLVYIAVGLQESLLTTPYTVCAPAMPSAKRQRYLGSTFVQYVSLSACVSIVLVLLGGALLAIAETATVATIAWMLAITIPCWLLRELARRCAYACLNLTMVLVVGIISATLQLSGLTFFFLSETLSAASALIAISLASGAAGLLWLGLTWREMRFAQRPLLASWQRNWQLGRWLAGSQLALMSRTHCIPWIVAFTLGTWAVGVLAACESILRLLNPIFMSVANVLTPRAAQAFAAGGVDAANQVLKKAAFGLAFVMGGACLLVVLFGSPLLGWSFGEEYTPYYLVLVVMTVTAFFSRMMVVPERGLMVLKRTDLCMIAELVGFAAMLVGVVVLIPLLDLLGAAFGYSSGTAAVVVVMVGGYLRQARHEQRDRATNSTSPVDALSIEQPATRRQLTGAIE